MTKTDDYEERIISGFTLALLEDFGYLHVIDNSYLTGGLMRFGKHKGCEFVNDRCTPDDTNKLAFSNEFYLPKNTELFPEPSCSSNRLGKTVYILHDKKYLFVTNYNKQEIEVLENKIKQLKYNMNNLVKLSISEIQNMQDYSKENFIIINNNYYK
jgi:hypothetical protein